MVGMFNELVKRTEPLWLEHILPLQVWRRLLKEGPLFSIVVQRWAAYWWWTWAKCWCFNFFEWRLGRNVVPWETMPVHQGLNGRTLIEPKVSLPSWFKRQLSLDSEFRWSLFRFQLLGFCQGLRSVSLDLGTNGWVVIWNLVILWLFIVTWGTRCSWKVHWLRSTAGSSLPGPSPC